MKFTNLMAYEYEAAFQQPIKTVLTTLTERKVLIISLDIDGKRFFAESNAFETPWYHHETISTVKESVMRIFEAIKHIEFDSYEALGNTLYAFKNTPHAIALFDYIGFQYFDSLEQVTVPLGYTLHGEMKEVSNRVKLKWHADILAQVREIRMLHPDIRIAIDANGSLGASDIPVLFELMDYTIDYFEEPFSDFKLYERYSELPLAIDESAGSIEDILKYRSIGVETIVVKYARLGGGYPLMKLQEAVPDLKVIMGGMYEFGLSKYFTARLSAMCHTIPDITPKGYYFSDDYCSYEETVEDGTLTMTFPAVDELKLRLVYQS